jgi:hypothetical protein
MYCFCTNQLIIHTNSWSTCSDGVLDAEETKELVKHLQFGGIQHRKSETAKQIQNDLPPVSHPQPGQRMLRSQSSKIKLTKGTRAVEVKTVEDDAEKSYEIITVKAYFV